MKSIRTVTKTCLTAAFCLGLLLTASSASMAEDAQPRPEWVDKYDKLCGQINVAQELSKEELDALIRECDILMGVITKSPEPRKKVYIYRLNLCREYFNYVRQLKDKPEPPKEQKK